MRQKTTNRFSKTAVFTALSIAAVASKGFCLPDETQASLPANAGRNFALNRAVVASDPNVSGWHRGLVDGSWETTGAHTFATGVSDVFPKTVTVDLEKAYVLSLIRVGVPNFGSTKTVQASISVDGKTYTEVGTYVFSQSKEEQYLFTFKPTPARYVRLTYPDHYTGQVNYPATYAFTTELEAYAPTDVAAQTEPVRPPVVITQPVAPVAPGEVIRPNLALNKPYVVSDPNKYNWGIGGLTNGSWRPTGQGAFATGDSATFPKTATIDLGQTSSVGHVIVGVPPFGSTKTVQVSVSPDGQAFAEVGSYVFSLSKAENRLFTFAPAQARYVRLTYPDHYMEQVNFPANFAFTTEVEVYPAGDAPTVPTPQNVPPQASAEPTDVAAPKLGSDGNINTSFQSHHESFLRRGKEGKIGVLFLGDSITAGWNGARDIWKTYFEKYEPANFGIGGDRTQHVLWRIANGELDGINPKVVVLMIGTNNIGSPAEEIIKGDKKIVAEIHRKLPNTKLLLLGIFPRGADAKNAARDKIKSVNAELAKLDDGNKTRYLDIGAKFLDAEGRIPADIMPDGLHPNVKGYQIWADAIQPLLDEMMTTK